MLKSSESCHDWTIHLILTLGSFWYLYNDANELFKPNVSKWTFIHSICPDDRLECVDCVRKAHLYIVSSADKIAAVIVISICFWHDATLTFSVIKCQPLRDWMPVGGAYVYVFLWRQCLCKDCARVTSPGTLDPNESFSEGYYQRWKEYKNILLK